MADESFEKSNSEAAAECPKGIGGEPFQLRGIRGREWTTQIAGQLVAEMGACNNVEYLTSARQRHNLRDAILAMADYGVDFDDASVRLELVDGEEEERRRRYSSAPQFQLLDETLGEIFNG
jgi:hypothetical protein